MANENNSVFSYCKVNKLHFLISISWNSNKYSNISNKYSMISIIQDLFIYSNRYIILLNINLYN